MANFELQEEIQALDDLSSYDIPNEQDISSLDSRAIDHLLESAVEALADSPDSITNPLVFDTYRSFLKHSSSLQGSTMNKLLDSISSAFTAEIEATLRDEDDDPQSYTGHKLPLEMYAFLTHWFVTAAEQVKSSGDEEDAPAPSTRPKRGRGGKTAAARAKKTQTWSWTGHIPNILSLICKVFRLKTQRIWTITAERDACVKCLTSPAYRAAENPEYMKDKEHRMWVYKVICLAVKHHGHALAAQITIMQNLQFFEHLGEPMAELLFVLVKEYDHQQLCDEVLREIAGKTYSAVDNKGGRTTSRFIVKLVELSPRSVLKQFSLLIALLDSEFYPMRVALVEVVAALIEDIATAEDVTDQNRESMKNRVKSLYGLLIERTLDLSVYVRSKVLNVLAKLCNLPVKFPKQRLKITEEAVACLEDSSSIVRKAAVILLKQLIVTHPYGLMHGGLLQLSEWEQRYEEVRVKFERVKGQVDEAVAAAGEGGSQEEEEEAEGEDEKGEDGEGDEDDEEGRAPRRKKSSHKRRRSENEMDIDGEEQPEEENEAEEAGEENAEEDGDEAEDEDVDMADGEGRPKKSKKQRRKSEINIERLNDMTVVQALQGEELKQLQLKRKYYSECLQFIRQLELSMKTIEDLLASKSKPEVLEAMDFFRIAHEYQLEGTEAGIKRMLHLIWSKDDSSTSEDGEKLKGIRSRLLECYQSLYFDPLPDLEPKQQVNRIAKNMIELTYYATLAELTSLEEMTRILMENDHIHSDVIAKLWQVYSSDRPLPRSQRCGAVIILGMLALARRSVVADHVDTLVKVGLGNKGWADLTLAKYTCIALQRLNGSAKKVKGSLLDKNIRLEVSNPLFRKLQDAIEHPCRTKEWFGMAEQAVNTIYALAERPDLVCGKLIKDLTYRAFAPRSAKSAPQSAPEANAMDEDINADPNVSQISGAQSIDTDEKDVGDAFELSQLLFVVGHVVIKQIVFLEQVEREWKRQKHEKETAAKAAGRNDPRGAKDNGEELDQVAGNAEDEIGERVVAMRESELLYGPNSLLAVFGPMLVHICGSPPKFKNRTLRAAATLAFSKFLCVSSQFCDQHHRLLFKILETSKDPSIRSNIVIALGDVAVSFSNIIDENSNELYKGLSDRNLVVKKNTLMVLTHLILNGMIKVKGQLGEMAKCLEDPDERIADLAKLFFSELATKDNAIYNNLPDVISHLSVGAHSVDEEAFQSTMTYIFKFIEKERQAENIVEKLCQRFRLTEDPRQWRDIAFCLSLLPFKSDRSVKKLIEGLPHYRDKLHEEEVFNRFQEILNKARANKSQNKPDAELNEFEQILEEHKRQGAEDQEFEKRVQGKKAAVKKRATRRSARKKAAEVEDSD